MRVSELWRYPVKSTAGERLQEAELTALGIAGDRIVRPQSASGRRITARTYPRLLGLRGSTAPDGSPLVDGLPWDSPQVAELVRRASDDDIALIRDETRVRFDVLPVSLVTDGALEVLGLDRRRLRPNIVLEGVEGLSERDWPGLAMRVGEAVVGVRQVRGRCVMTTYDPDTLEADPGVLRRFVEEFDGRFALDCYVVEPGLMRVGDKAELLDHWTIERDEPSRQLGNVAPRLARRLDPAGADVRGAPVGQVRDLDDVAGARRVHDLSAADVDPDVVQGVEEDEVTRLQQVARHG